MRISVEITITQSTTEPFSCTLKREITVTLDRTMPVSPKHVPFITHIPCACCEHHIGKYMVQGTLICRKCLVDILVKLHEEPEPTTTVLALAPAN